MIENRLRCDLKDKDVRTDFSVINGRINKKVGSRNNFLNILDTHALAKEVRFTYQVV